MLSELSATRKATEKLLENQRIAALGMFQHLPKPVFTKIVKSYTSRFLGKTAYLLLDTVLLRCVKKEDLIPGGRVIVVISHRQIEEETGLSKSSIVRGMGELVDGGLLAYRDSPNCKRWQNAKQGRHGFDLTPAAVRLKELAELVQEDIRAQRLVNEQQKLIAKRKRQIKAIFNTLPDPSPEAQRIADKAATINKQPLDYATRIQVLHALRAHLITLQNGQNQTTIETQCQVKSDTHKTNTLNRNCNVNIGALEKECEGSSGTGTATAGVTREELRQWEEIQERQKKFAFPMNSKQRIELVKAHEGAGDFVDVGAVNVEMLRTACPEVQALLHVQFRSWESLTLNSQELQYLIQLSKGGYAWALESCGPYVAHICLCIVAEKALRNPGEIRNPAGYFVTMCNRALSGELRLTKTLCGLKKQRANGS